MANLVSLPRLNKIGLHYDTAGPGVLFKQNGLSRIPAAELTEGKIGHWIIEDLRGKELASAAASSSSGSRKIKIKTAVEWHTILVYPSIRAIE
ncbi:hypothetical protein EPUL_004401, partial [Erysiphe pulchra]